MPKSASIVVLCLSATLLMIGVGSIVALLPQRVYSASGSLESVGLIASVFAMAYLLTQLPVGMLSDRLGAKPFLVVGYGLCGIAGKSRHRREVHFELQGRWWSVVWASLLTDWRKADGPRPCCHQSRRLGR